MTFNYLKDFIDNKLHKEELSSILRRSAGIPFIITTLIKSYIGYDKQIGLTHNTFVRILKYSIDNLLETYMKCKALFNIDQYSISDTSVHCLHITRVITDDTILKPFAREFYDHILFTIVDGLNQNNWSIKNACMLLFSRLIKNSFMLDKRGDRNAPTFVEYFANKEEFKKKFFSIFTKEVGSDSTCNSILIMLVNFICKFKKSKTIETLDSDLIELVEILFKLGYKNNKIFRKLLSSSIITLCGTNVSICYELLKREITRSDIDNNSFDFIANMVEDIIRNDMPDDSISEEQQKNELKKAFLNEVSEILKDLYSKHKDNYFILNKITKLSLKLNIELDDNVIAVSDNAIDFSALSVLLNKKSKIPFFAKYIKNKTISLLSRTNSTVKFNLSDITDTNEELTVYLLKKYPSRIISQSLKNSIISNMALLNDLNVNISSKIIEYITDNSDNLPEDKSDNLIKNILTLFNTNQSTTKLLDKLFLLIGRLFSNCKDETLMLDVVSLIYTYCQSGHEDTIRYSSITCFENVLLSIPKSFAETYLFNILKILIFTLNDEHPEIRNMASKQLTGMFNKHYPSTVKTHTNLIYTSENLIRQLLSIDLTGVDTQFKQEMSKLYTYLIKNNLYYPENIHLNNESKVFFYEPDNRFIDNIEMKLTIMKNRVFAGLNISMTEADLPPARVLLMLEIFTQYLTDNYSQIESNLRKETINKASYIMNLVREYIYNY
jgi:hypothetical protein